MRTITVVLGGRPIEVPQLAIDDEVAWREMAKPLVDPIGEMVMAAGIANPTPERMVRLAFTSGLFMDLRAVLNAVLAYSPVLEDARAWIGANAYSDELMEALVALFFGVTSSKPGAAPATNGDLTPTTWTS